MLLIRTSIIYLPVYIIIKLSNYVISNTILRPFGYTDNMTFVQGASKPCLTVFSSCMTKETGQLLETLLPHSGPM